MLRNYSLGLVVELKRIYLNCISLTGGFHELQKVSRLGQVGDNHS